jgi:hypothetical protein
MKVWMKFWNNREKKFEERQYYCVDEVKVESNGAREGKVEINGIELKV